MKYFNGTSYYYNDIIISNNKFKANIKKERHHSTVNWCLSELKRQIEQR